jgi:uncharacterized SAM-binding protein YcdF (DUF218 family)
MLVLAFYAVMLVIAGLCLHLWRQRLERTRRWWIGIAGLIIALAVFVSLARSELMFLKILGLLLMPAGLLWLALGAMAIWAWRRGQTAVALALCGLFLGHTLAGNQLLGTWLTARLERGVAWVDPTTVPRFDAVCVLGGGTDTDADGHDELNESGDRVVIAARLYLAGKTGFVVASGTEIPHIDNSQANLADQAANIWRGLNIPEQAIIRIPPGPINTAQEVAAYKALIAARGWTRVGLVSSAWHLPRALRLCDDIGLSMIPIPSDHRNRMPALSPYWLIPQGSGYALVHHACWEMLGCLLRR